MFLYFPNVYCLSQITFVLFPVQIIIHFCNFSNLYRIFLLKANWRLWYNDIIKMETRLFKRKIESCNLKLAKYFSKRSTKMWSKQRRHIYYKFHKGFIFSVFNVKALLISPTWFLEQRSLLSETQNMPRSWPTVYPQLKSYQEGFYPTGSTLEQC